MMSRKLRGDNIMAINDGGNTLADPSTTSWSKVCTLRYGEGNAKQGLRTAISTNDDGERKSREVNNDEKNKQYKKLKRSA